ncbi:uncharacterized protein LOC126678329 [Mercurialis annua]|uniref:uncharacterized protein LOC126678329 n=1 Tax=Mercurialis annua TaxID=3986 RepID=UPI00215E03F9|nr:uncharacterized protein LOC126678329 [Mercurialis annua]
MILLDVIDAILCKTFPTTLRDIAQRWYNGLKAGSIATWRLLNRQFMLRFFMNIPPEKSSEELYRCRQGEGETLRAYIERFNNQGMKIEDFNNDTVVQSLKKGDMDGSARRQAKFKKLKTYQEVTVVAKKCINMDDRRRHKTSDT